MLEAQNPEEEGRGLQQQQRLNAEAPEAEGQDLGPIMAYPVFCTADIPTDVCFSCLSHQNPHDADIPHNHVSQPCRQFTNPITR